MSRKRVGNGHKLATKRGGKRKAFTVIGLTLCLIAVSAALGHWKSTRSVTLTNSASQKTVEQATQPASTASFTQPSKEYIYAGNKLIATEEPPAHHAGTIGVYDPSTRTFYLRNINAAGDADIQIQYGPANSVPVAGDWNGDGTTTIGVYESASRTFYLRNANSAGNADITVQYGPAGAVPLAGDWDGL